LSQEIEDYLSKNTDYNFRKDNLIGGSSTNYGLFSSIRVDYWKNMCMESSGCDLLTEPEKLYQYYDLHKNIQTSMFDSSRIDWVSAGADSASFVVGVAALIVAPEYAVGVNLVSQGFGGFSAFHSFSSGDNTGGLLSVGGFARPPFGTLASGASVIRDFSAGFYYVPYAPPILR